MFMALSVLGAALAIPTAFAGNGPANKTTGDFWYDNLSGGAAHFVFNAQDLGATGDKGSVTFEDPIWGSFTANVVDAVVRNGNATFTAKLTSSTYRWAQTGDTYTWTVYDKGEGQSGTGDSFTYDSATIGGVVDPGTGATQYPATAGNIQVHYNI
jgi:hypothetical protein